MNIILALLVTLLIFPNFVLTDYIDCSESCPTGDRNYEVIASVRDYPLQGIYTLKTRTYSKSDTELYGETLRVKPGESLSIKVVNNLYPIYPTPYPMEYYYNLSTGRIPMAFPLNNNPVESVEDFTVKAHMPHNYEVTNLHLHGPEISAHMFYPLGTEDPHAEHIAINPGECVCYWFDILPEEPPGLYWYHAHYHSSTAVQVSGGMFGLLEIESDLLQTELANYNVTTSFDFVYWNPYVERNETDNYVYIAHPDDSFREVYDIQPHFINGEILPEFDVSAGEIVRFRILQVALDSGHSNLYIYPADNTTYNNVSNVLPFWGIASDGCTYDNPWPRISLPIVPGCRDEILVEFANPGRYVFRQEGSDRLDLAYINVVDTGADIIHTVAISDFVLTPGISSVKDVIRGEITKPMSFIFNLYGDRTQVPLPMGLINDQPFEDTRLDFEAAPGEAIDITLINPQGAPHPFHIHINRFQVISMSSGQTTASELLNYPPKVWRDTIIIPGLGFVKLYMRIGNITGKTLFHCHKLFHEDAGMAGTILYRNPPVPESTPEGLVWWFPWALSGGLGFLALVFLSALIAAQCTGKKVKGVKRSEYNQIDQEEQKLENRKLTDTK